MPVESTATLKLFRPVRHNKKSYPDKKPTRPRPPYELSAVESHRPLPEHRQVKPMPVGTPLLRWTVGPRGREALRFYRCNRHIAGVQQALIS